MTGKTWFRILGKMSLLSQMGFSLTAPLILCLLICFWADSCLKTGIWVYIPGFIFGLGGSGASAYKIYRGILKDTRKEETEERQAFNEHQ